MKVCNFAFHLECREWVDMKFSSCESKDTVRYDWLLQPETYACTSMTDQHGSHSLMHFKPSFYPKQCSGKFEHSAENGHSFHRSPTRYFHSRYQMIKQSNPPVFTVFIDRWHNALIWSKIYCGLVWLDSLNHADSPLVCHTYCPYMDITT